MELNFLAKLGANVILKAHNHLLAKFLICQFTLPIEHIYIVSI